MRGRTILGRDEEAEHVSGRRPRSGRQLLSINVVSWNVGKRDKPWRELLTMDADVALLQEAGSPPPDIPDQVKAGPAAHFGDGLFDRWPMVVKLSERVEVEWFRQVGPVSATAEDEIAVSRIGAIAAARIIPRDQATAPFIAVSMYARWIAPHPLTGSSWMGYADGSAHRIISDLSAFIGRQRGHRILASRGSQHPLRLRRERQ